MFTRKGIKYIWLDKCEVAFQTLKQLLTHAPILIVPEGNYDLVTYTDACGSGLGLY